MPVWSDARVAARTLLRSPGFSLTALLTLVVGMSATALALTAVNAVLLRPFPVRAPDRVVGITTVGELAVLGNEPVGFGDYADLARDVAAFESVVAHRRMGSVAGLHGPGQAKRCPSLADVVPSLQWPGSERTLGGIRPSWGRR